MDGKTTKKLSKFVYQSTKKKKKPNKILIKLIHILKVNMGE